MPERWGMHVATEKDAERELKIKMERQALLAWLSNRPDVYVHTIVKTTPIAWTVCYIRAGVEYQLRLEVTPEPDPFD